MSSHNDTFHVYLGKRRTTVTLDKIISALLALKVDATPETPQGHAAVRQYLQKMLDEAKDPGRIYVSQWLREEVVLTLVDTKISKKYWAWFDKAK